MANARLIAAAPNLLEALENVTASLETVLDHYGRQMPADDHQRCWLRAKEARNVIDQATGS